jgi:hypothetical protein
VGAIAVVHPCERRPVSRTRAWHRSAQVHEADPSLVPDSCGEALRHATAR